MVTSAIKASGGDYTTIQAWHDATRSAGDIGECYNEVYAENVTLSKDSLIQQAASGEKHSGTAGTGARVIPSTGHAFTLTGSPFSIYDMEVSSGDNTSNECFRLNDSGATGTLNIERCLRYMGSQSGGQGDGIYIDYAWTVNDENCFSFGHDRNDFSVSHDGDTGATSTINAKHLSTATTTGKEVIEHFNGTINFTGDGCLLGNDGSNPVFDSPGAGDWGTKVLNDCIMIDGSATTEGFTLTNCLENQTFTTSTASSAVIFTNLTAGSEDLHLTDHANNLAQDHVADARRTVTDDIDDEARPSGTTNDAGADEFVTVAASAIPVMMASYRRRHNMRI